MAPAKTATVLRIEKTSIHDGAGLRTVVFLKGCPLTCTWCSTPESQCAALEIGLNRHKCDDCGECVTACTEGCLTIDEQGLCRLDPGACSACLEHD